MPLSLGFCLSVLISIIIPLEAKVTTFVTLRSALFPLSSTALRSVQPRTRVLPLFSEGVASGMTLHSFHLTLRIL